MLKYSKRNLILLAFSSPIKILSLPLSKNSNGEELISCVFKEMYMEMSSGKTEYYMIWQDPEGKERKYVIKDYLEK